MWDPHVSHTKNILHKLLFPLPPPKRTVATRAPFFAVATAAIAVVWHFSSFTCSITCAKKRRWWQGAEAPVASVQDRPAQQDPDGAGRV